MKKILLRGYYGFGNAGDDALLTTILKYIEREDREIRILSKYKLDSSLIKTHLNFPLNTKELFKNSWNADVMIYGGGSQLQDFGRLKNKLALIRSLMTNKLMNIRKAKVIYLGVSIGPINTKTGNFLIKLLMKSANLIYVRDEASLKFLQETRIDKFRFGLTPDIVLGLNPLIDRSNIEENNTVGLNLMSHFSQVENKPEVEKKILQSVVEMIEKYPNKRYRFFQFQNSSQMNDQSMYIKLKELLCENKGFKGDLEFIDYKNLAELLEEMTMCESFIGMRLHSAVLCDALNIPHVLLSYHPKGMGYASVLNYKENMIVNSEEEKDFSSKLLSLINNPIDYIVSNEMLEKKNIVKEVFNEINNMIDKKVT